MSHVGLVTQAADFGSSRPTIDICQPRQGLRQSDGTRILVRDHAKTMNAETSEDSWMPAAGLKWRRHGLWGRTCALAFSPNGQRLIVGSDDNRLRVWDVGSGELLTELAAVGQGGVRALASSRDSAWVASTNEDGSVWIWDWASDATPQVCEASASAAIWLEWDAAAQSLYGLLRDGTVQRWDRCTGRTLDRVDPFAVLRANAADRGSAAVSGEYYFWQSELTGTMLVAHHPDGTCRSITVGPIKWSAACVSLNGQYLALAREATAEEPTEVLVWDLLAQALVQRLMGVQGRVDVLRFAPDSRLVLGGGEECSLTAWDIELGCRRSAQPGHRHRISSLAISPDRRWLASASGSTEQHADGSFGHGDLLLWRAQAALDSTQIAWPDLSASWARRALCSGDGDQLAVEQVHPGGSGIASVDLAIWDSGASVVRRPRPWRAGPIQWLNFAPGDRRLVIGSNSTGLRKRTPQVTCDVDAWNLRWGWLRRAGTGLPGTPLAVGFAGRRILLATAHEDGMLRLWRLPRRRPIRVLPLEHGPVLAAAFSPDGQWIASSHITPEGAGQVVIRDVATSEVLRLHRTATPAQELAFAPDGRRLGYTHATLDGELSGAGVVVVVDVTALRVLASWPFEERPWRLRFSWDGQRLLALTAYELHLANVDTGICELALACEMRILDVWPGGPSQPACVVSQDVAAPLFQLWHVDLD
jgi:WD40 repeat protein